MGIQFKGALGGGASSRFQSRPLGKWRRLPSGSVGHGECAPAGCRIRSEIHRVPKQGDRLVEGSWVIEFKGIVGLELVHTFLKVELSLGRNLSCWPQFP